MNSDVDIVGIAKRLAYDVHRGQTRKDGITPAILHPLEVVKTLTLWGVTDPNMIAAAWLHDTLEDTDLAAQKIVVACGETVYHYVKALTFPSEVKENRILKQIVFDKLTAEAQQEVIIIKTADRINNVLDFIIDGDLDYAPIYFHKADKLFDRVYELAHAQYESAQNALSCICDLREVLRKLQIKQGNVK